ncbi:HotDog domain-containing protein [Staphylotrichum tortipilum]|uniref:HotDog domain-containing protein n=1 Tax=Staphylotrichum tortipilum TaxID=2831512 RepID=A0AAN6RT80_9PEZI|nr:HotDog domain-containing protein [Staphylotrichum longicolle]
MEKTNISQEPKPETRDPQQSRQQNVDHASTKQAKLSGPGKHNQYIKNPLAHFLAIPWTARALTDPAVLDIVVSDRSQLAAGDMQFVRDTLNSATTVRACVTYFLKLPSRDKPEEEQQQQPVSKNKALLQGGGLQDGEDPNKPFLLFNALLDLGEGMCGFKGMLHGGAVVVLLDEMMCAAADNQSQCAYTATMTTNFLKPVKVPGVVVVRSRVVKKEGRKIWARGTVEDGEGNVLTECEAMMVDQMQVAGRKTQL